MRIISAKRRPVKIIYLDPLMLAEIAGAEPEPEFEPELERLRDIIRKEVLALEYPAGEILIRLYFEGMDAEAAAAEIGLSPESVIKISREALHVLKNRLRQVVHKRWPKFFPSAETCPICAHPERAEIERIITAKIDSESWGSVNRKLKKSVGRIFNPPMIIINHLKYHRGTNNG